MRDIPKDDSDAQWKILTMVCEPAMKHALLDLYYIYRHEEDSVIKAYKRILLTYLTNSE